MTFNNVLNGYPNGNFNPKPDEDATDRKGGLLKRTEGCKIISKCIFNLDDNTPTILANIEYTEVPEQIELNVGLDGKKIEDISFGANDTIVYNINIEDTNYRYMIEVCDDNDISAILTVGNEKQTPVYGSVFIIPAGTNECMLELTLNSGNYNTGLHIIPINAPQEIIFEQQSLDENGNPNYYIFVDSPESLKREDLLNAEDKTRTISRFKSLQPGTYTVFCYHHKKRPAKDDNGNIIEDTNPCLDSSDKLYYNGVFYGYQGNGKVKINRIGLTYYERDGWNDFYKAEEMFNAVESESTISQDITNIIKNGTNVWLTDINKMP